MAGIEEKIVKVRVSNKYERKKGLIFKKQEYFVELYLVNERDIIKRPTTIKIPLHRYNVLDVGSELDVNMYSADGEKWFFERIYAELLKKNDVF